MTFTVTPAGIPAPYKYTFNGVLFYNGAETFTNEPPFGSLDIGIPTYPVGITSQTAFGNPSLLHAVVISSGITGPVFGALTIGQAAFPTGIASGTIFGASHVYTAIFPSGIPTKIAFGADDIAHTIVVTGIPTVMIFGTNIKSYYTILPTGLIRSTAFGNLITEHEVVDFSIPSAMAFGNPLVAFPIHPQGFNNSTIGITNIGYPTLTFNSTNLSSLIFIYDAAFYNALRAMETYCYARTNGLSTYGSGFTSLSNAIVAWINVNRTTLMSNYMTSLFSYIVMNLMYGTSNSQLSSSIYNRVWSMNGYNAAIKAAANTYYADGTGSKLTTDANAVTTTTTNGTDDTTASNLITQFNLVVANKISSLSLNPTPPLPLPWNKSAVTNLIFVTLGYKHLYLSFNAGLTLPPGV